MAATANDGGAPGAVSVDPTELCRYLCLALCLTPTCVWAACDTAPVVDGRSAMTGTNDASVMSQFAWLKESYGRYAEHSP